MKEENSRIILKPAIPRYAGYCDCFLSTPLFFRLENYGTENLSVRVKSEESELFLPYEEETEVPYGSEVTLRAEGLFSPRFLAENNEERVFTFSASAYAGGEKIASRSMDITALPFDYWEGLSGTAEKAACFVRPRAYPVARVLKEGKRRLVKWGAAEFSGYKNADKNEVRKQAIAILTAVRELGFTSEGNFDLSRPVLASPPSPVAARRASGFRLALLAAACLERAGLHAVLALGKSRAGVGAWLFDSCFLETSTDDFKTAENYLAAGHLSFFDAEELFATCLAPLTSSSERFLRGLKGGQYDCFVDIRRCRLSGFAPCPMRGEGESGYEIYKEDSGVPAPTPEYTLPEAEKQPKNKLWERGLLDFSPRNPLLAFKEKNALKILAPDADELVGLAAKEGLTLRGGGRESALLQERELLSLEEKKGILRTPLTSKETDEIARRLRRKNREAAEETGAKILFLACGFLRYGKEERLAPIVLFPAELNHAKGKEGFALTVTKEYFLNATLLEFLRQEYAIDLRGMDRATRSVKEILALVRREIAGMGGFEVVGDIYLSVFSFQRFFMWNDLNSHFKEFIKNRAVHALFTGKAENDAPMPEGVGSPEDLALPMPTDASQREAIFLSDRGGSFVLHGPPGTGKSQTITNMIALALERGKSVLFVAEKRAAIEVVKKRLKEVGLGDFCLELGAKSEEEEAFKKLNRTLLLKGMAEDPVSESRAEFTAARQEIEAPLLALHKKRKLSLSVHEAILAYLERKELPTLLKIGSEFFDSLDEKRLAECRQLVLSCVEAAKACGGVFNSPFENVNLKEYSPEVRDVAIYAASALLGESAHFKCFLSLVLDFFKQRISAFTEKRARTLVRICEELLSGKYTRYFKGITAEEFLVFRSANLRLDRCLDFYAERFRILVNPDKDFDELNEFLATGGDYRFNRAARSLKVRLEKAALSPLAEEDIPKYLQTVMDIYGARKKIAACPLASHFTDRGGRIIEKKRAEFLAPLKELSEAAASVFSEYGPDLFFEGCIRAESGCARPVFEGFIRAAAAFFDARADYFAATAADEKRIAGEDILGYASAKAAALLENADLLQGRCAYKAAEENLKERGMKFVGDALENGTLSPDGALGGFEKSVYERFLTENVSGDPHLSRTTFAGGENGAEKFRLIEARLREETRARVRQTLIKRLPEKSEFQEEFSALFRLTKSGRRGRLRNLFAEASALVKRVCPCLLLSPDAAAQYLRAKANDYDLVIFDEASQMTTAEAIPALARAKQAIVVGDDKQLPPTAFFRTVFTEEEGEGDCLESVLDDALAAGFEERSLSWHYRSRHESLIAFSNAAYYGGRLNTFPSPVSGESRVKLVKVGGTYERGGSKKNRKEAEALAEEVIRRLSDPALSKLSIGVVTFSEVQREEIERVLSREISKRSLDEIAYGGREPLFVKNLENVQGDERDVILFSVCYGYDKEGKLSYNFGALNRAGGWRRLNVACSRAREEMLVFSSILAEDIDLNRTSSEGMAGLKSFLEFAEKGRFSARPQKKAGRTVGEYLASELAAYGYECRVGVGASAFKIDVAVLDPRDKSRFLLGILFDGAAGSSAVDRASLLPSTLKRGDWNLLSVSEVSYFNNPKREVKRVKDHLDRLTGAVRESRLSRYAKPYRFATDTGGMTLSYVSDGGNENEILKRLNAIVATEEPISRPFLKKRCMESFGIVKGGASAERRLDELIARLDLFTESVGGVEYFYKHPRAIETNKFRLEGRNRRRRVAEDFTPFETAALVKGILEEKVTLYEDELTSLVASAYGVKETDSFAAFVLNAIEYGERKGKFTRSRSGRISLA